MVKNHSLQKICVSMEVTELDIPESLSQKLLEKGIRDLNPPQVQAVEKGVLEGKSMIVSSPTASGKTLIATLAISKVLEAGKKAIYLVPLKALASEKYRDYKKLFGEDYKVSISIGDKDSSGSKLSSKDLIVMTVEKLDAVLRHNPTWIKDVDLVVEDEIHLLNSRSRGPTLEVTLTRLRELMNFQLLGLSATINNSDVMADWLDSVLVESDYRPVELKEGVYWDGKIEFFLNKKDVDIGSNNDSLFKRGTEKLEEERLEENLEKEVEEIKKENSKPTLDLFQDALERKKQTINFVNSRKSAEAEAEKVGKVCKKFLDRKEVKQLAELSEDLKEVLGSPTKQCKRLARCVKNGSAFHHAGLTSKQRSMVEEAFRKDLIKSVSATPTLAAGVSMPAYRIIIRDLKRYTDSGLNFIPVLEYKQMAGRAGRPEHHSEGQAVSVAKNQGMRKEIRDRYILGEPENIYSKLAVEPVLRMHTLSLIATGFVENFEQLKSFFAETFYAYQYGDIGEIENKLMVISEKLEDYDFIHILENNSFKPTRLGRRIAELYIDPETAYHFIDCMEAERGSSTSLSLLNMLCQTVEMKPFIRVKNKEISDLEDIIGREEKQFFKRPPDPWDPSYESFLESFKTAIMLQSWIEEVEEDGMMEKFGVTPGGIRAKVNNADWLLYSLEELSNLKGWEEMREDIRKLRTRIKHGIREELVKLVRFKQIGRVRARRLYNNGVRTSSDIRETGFTKLKKLIGRKTAKKLKEQVGQENVFDKENIMDYF